MIDGEFWRICLVVAATMAVGFFLFGCAPLNIDVNGYRAGPAHKGRITCTGACP